MAPHITKIDREMHPRNRMWVATHCSDLPKLWRNSNDLYIFLTKLWIYRLHRHQSRKVNRGVTETCLLQCWPSINQIWAVHHLVVLSVVCLVYSWQLCSNGLIQWPQHLVYDSLIYPPWYQLITFNLVA